VAWPNPNPGQIAVELNGQVASLILRIYTVNMVMAAEVETMSEGPGWVEVRIPESFIEEAAAGVYYYRITAAGSQKGVVGRFVLTK
jgi:hypothetical protein